jgi:hypothetical protein
MTAYLFGAWNPDANLITKAADYVLWFVVLMLGYLISDNTTSAIISQAPVTQQYMTKRILTSRGLGNQVKHNPRCVVATSLLSGEHQGVETNQLAL